MTEWQSIVATGVIQNSYGSFVRSGRKPPQTMVQHFVDATDTLQGISLKYGVNMEDLRRINKLHYTDSIQSRKFLNIPVSKDSNHKKLKVDAVATEVGSKHSVGENDKSKENKPNLEAKTGEKRVTETEISEESSVHDFLRKLDMQIQTTKRTASSMLSDKDYKLPNSAHAPSAHFLKKEDFEDSVSTTFSNSNSYHNPTDEMFQL